MNQISIGNKLVINDSDDAPELTEANFAQARYQIAGNSVSRAEWQNAVKSQMESCSITLNMDVKIIEYFKALAGENDYKKLINHVLSEYVNKFVTS